MIWRVMPFDVEILGIPLKYSDMTATKHKLSSEEICLNDAPQVPCAFSYKTWLFKPEISTKLNPFSWKEIWKLKHLPQLESLILSGNPIEQIFYKQEADCQLCRLNSAVGSERDVSMETENDVSMKTERGISMEIQEMVEELVGDVLRRASRVRTEDVPDKTGSDQRIEDVPDNTRCDHSEPFSRLRLICLSKTQLDDWTHCSELRKYPALESLRIKVGVLQGKVFLHLTSVPHLRSVSHLSLPQFLILAQYLISHYHSISS